MRQLLIPAAALALLASPAAAAWAGQPATASHEKAASTSKTPSAKMGRAESQCLKNARSKYEAGSTRNRAEAKCRQGSHMKHRKAARPTEPAKQKG